MKILTSNNERWAIFALAQRLLFLSLFLLALTGCQTETPDNFPQQNADISRQMDQLTNAVPQQSSELNKGAQSESMLLREGDSISISIPGSPTLDTTEQIRIDGKIVLPLVGEVTAAGMTPEDLQNELLKLYKPQVAAKQVIVTVQSPNIPVYVIGAVLRPGPLTANHEISALDAIMEAGGFDFTRANMKAVVVVRQEKDRTVRYKINLKKAWAGSTGNPFYLKPFDIVYVPERFTWY